MIMIKMKFTTTVRSPRGLLDAKRSGALIYHSFGRFRTVLALRRANIHDLVPNIFWQFSTCFRPKVEGE